MQSLKSYQMERADEETGEVIIESKYIYLPGRPRDYRFNGQNGQFTIGGDRILLDERSKPISQFVFQPISYRIFDDQLFGRDKVETWAEIFFVDADHCVSSIMFNNTSVSELYRMMEPLFYERKSLTDVVVTAKPEKVTSKSDSGKSWFLCRFSYSEADPAKIKEYRDFVRDHRVLRADSITHTANHKLVSKGFELPEAGTEPLQLEAGEGHEEWAGRGLGPAFPAYLEAQVEEAIRRSTLPDDRKQQLYEALADARTMDDLQAIRQEADAHAPETLDSRFNHLIARER